MLVKAYARTQKGGRTGVWVHAFAPPQRLAWAVPLVNALEYSHAFTLDTGLFTEPNKNHGGKGWVMW